MAVIADQQIQAENNSGIIPSVDIVITWVDGNDAVLNQKRQAYFTGDQAKDAVSATRFASNHEIYFCIASVLKYMPYAGTIYVVTDNQCPEWLHEFASQHLCAADKIKLIDHHVLFRAHEQYLPTFNSLSIEAMLWNIPGLSEQFIYLNDDVFINSDSVVSDCFIDNKVVVYGKWKNNLPVKLKYIFRQWLAHWRGKKIQPKFTTAQMLSAELAGLGRYYELQHRPHFIKKSLLQDYFKQHSNILEHQINFRFRDISQFLPTGLANHLAVQAHQAVLKADEAVAYIKPGDSHVERFVQALQDPKIKYGCIQSFDMMDAARQAVINKGMVEKFYDFLPQQVKDKNGLTG